MTHVIAGILLFAGVGVALLCCIALPLLRGPFNKLHLVGPASTIAPVLIAAAVVVEDGWAITSIKAVLVAVILLAVSPILTHATARAARRREEA
jgi:multicomponent Na+:H+ antiporter subunit G